MTGGADPFSSISVGDVPDNDRRTPAYAALERYGKLVPYAYSRRELRERDVEMEVLFCGVCHTDLHAVGPWGQEFPLIPGHEIIGRVTEVGSGVTRFKPGDVVAVGTIVASCGTCEHCAVEMESYCKAYAVGAFDGLDPVDGTRTRGGYAQYYISDEHFVYAVPEGMDLAATAPLLCAGITTYSPLRHWKVGPGSVVGIVGIGGLGHLAVKIARAMGAHVVAFANTPERAEAALDLGAHEAVLTTDEAAMRAQAFRFDFILDTVPNAYPMAAVVSALKLDSTICSLGLPSQFDFPPYLLALGRRSLASSGSGGTRETREMLDFCAEHGITADIELIAPHEINTALARLERGDVKYRFVMDMRLG